MQRDHYELDFDPSDPFEEDYGVKESDWEAPRSKDKPKEIKVIVEPKETDQVPKPKAKRWKFTMERDFNGKLQSIVATTD